MFRVSNKVLGISLFIGIKISLMIEKLKKLNFKDFLGILLK